MGAGRIGLTQLQIYDFFFMIQNGEIDFSFLRCFVYLCKRNLVLFRGGKSNHKTKIVSAWIS
jgi:hypothetical protein